MSSPGFPCAISKPQSSSTDPESFQFECREAHKSRRAFLQGGNVEILLHEHYVAKGEEESTQTCMDVYELSDIEPLLAGKLLLEEGGDGPLITHTYTYKLLSSHGATAAHTSEYPEDLVMVSFDPPVTHLDEINRWYEEEHIPMLKKVPGWQSTLRGKMLLVSRDGDASLPKYAGLHRYAPGNGCGTSEQWKEACDTPWRNSLIAVIDKEGASLRTEWKFQPT